MMRESLDAIPRLTLVRRGLRLIYFTLVYNVLEGVVAVGSGILAGSIALVGFGLDSFVEVFAAAVLLWRLRQAGLDDDGEEESAAERRAEFLVGVTFVLLAAYIVFEAGSSLIYRELPEESWVGIGLAILSLFVMPALARVKLRVARALGSRALRAEAAETLVCTYLSFTLLLGLGANALWGLWWADPVAALVMVPLVLREGWEGIRGED